MRVLPVVFALFFAVTCNAVASDYNFISPDKLKSDIESNVKTLVVDIQVKEEFDKHHIKGSIPTYAYPVKSESDTQKLDMAFQKQQETGEPVVIVCPRGAGGAKRTYDYLKGKGIDEANLSILEKGMGGWPYSELAVTN